MTDNREAYRRLASMGLDPIPLKEGGKRPYHENWTERGFTEEDLQPTDNLGLRLSEDLIDIDLDCPEAMAVATVILPKTGLVSGRASAPRSHWFYKFAGAKPRAWKDPDGVVYLEIRTGKKQETMVPPSVHPNGETTVWEAFGEPAKTDPSKACALVATAVLAIRAWPPEGARHDFGLALAGTLKGLGVNGDDAERIIRAAAAAAGDRKPSDRALEARTTYSSTGPVLGAGRLEEIAPGLAEALREALGTKTTLRAVLTGGFVAERGRILPGDPRNIREALRRMGVGLRYNAFTMEKLFREGDGAEKRLEDEDLMRLWEGVQTACGFLPTRETFLIICGNVAMEGSFHPVLDWLKSLEWDHVSRIDTWLRDYLGAPDTPLLRRVGELILRAATRRVMEPGAKFDELPVLEAPQGAGKSSALLALCPDPSWFTDCVTMGAQPREVMEQTSGKWIVEVAELFGIGRREIDQVKGFLSRQVDEARLSYGRERKSRPRQFVCIGTTNQLDYLRDLTGNRRFWPVRCGKRIDHAGIARDRDQLWAEAFIKAKDSLRLEEALWGDAAREQESREEGDPWGEALREWLKDPPEHVQFDLSRGNEEDGRETRRDPNRLRVLNEDLWEALGIPMDRRDARGQSRISSLMRKMEFEKKRIRRKGTNHWGWERGG